MTITPGFGGRGAYFGGGVGRLPSRSHLPLAGLSQESDNPSLWQGLVAIAIFLGLSYVLLCHTLWRMVYRYNSALALWSGTAFELCALLSHVLGHGAGHAHGTALSLVTITRNRFSCPMLCACVRECMLAALRGLPFFLFFPLEVARRGHGSF